MAAGDDTKHQSLLERWRALAPAEPKPPRRSRPPPPPSEPVPLSQPAPRDPPAAPDSAALLASIEAAIAAAATGDREALGNVARASLDPIREALAAPPEARDPTAIAAMFEVAEDLLEALFLAPAPAPES